MMFRLVRQDFEHLLNTVSRNVPTEGSVAIKPPLAYYDSADSVWLYLPVDGITYYTRVLKEEGFDETKFKLEILSYHGALQLEVQPKDEGTVTLRILQE